MNRIHQEEEEEKKKNKSQKVNYKGQAMEMMGSSM